METGYRLLSLSSLLILLSVSIGGCAAPTITPAPDTATPEPTTIPSPGPTPEPELGATRTRESDGMTMVYVPAGEFLIGSTPGDGAAEGYRAYENEFPQHEETVAAFWLDKTEVTNTQYRLCVKDGRCSPPIDTSSHTHDPYYGDPEFEHFPVINVTWYQAGVYCSWAGGRLPHEVEWAFAARGPDSLFYPWGNTFDKTRLNYCDTNCDRPYPDEDSDDGYACTAPVGSYPGGAS